jgi:hypothetical protein
MDDRIHIEEGKRYRLRNGIITGRMSRNTLGGYSAVAGMNSVSWEADGRLAGLGETPQYDVVEELPNPSAIP